MTSESAQFRLAAPEDAAGCLAIYGPVVESSTTSFELDLPTAAEFAGRIEAIMQVWPWLVAVTKAGRIAGYAYACKHRERAAYRWCVEVSAYVDTGRKRRGLGRGLYTILFACLAAQGFHRAFAGITLPNDASVGFHRSLGFAPVGVYENAGFKLGAWHSVSWWQQQLQRDPATPPAEPRPLSTCRAEIERLIASYQGSSVPE